MLIVVRLEIRQRNLIVSNSINRFWIEFSQFSKKIDLFLIKRKSWLKDWKRQLKDRKRQSKDQKRQLKDQKVNLNWLFLSLSIIIYLFSIFLTKSKNYIIDFVMTIQNQTMRSDRKIWLKGNLNLISNKFLA